MLFWKKHVHDTITCKIPKHSRKNSQLSVHKECSCQRHYPGRRTVAPIACMLI